MALANLTAWSDRLDEFLARMCDCLEENTPQGAPVNPDGSFNCYKIHSDEWPGDCCDALILKVVQAGPVDATVGFPAPAGPAPRNARGCAISLKIDFQLRLFRPCGVMAQTNNIAPILPSGTQLEDEANLALIDINAMLCCLACDFGFTDPTVQLFVGQSTAFKSGDCYGWQINGSITMPRCDFA